MKSSSNPTSSELHWLQEKCESAGYRLRRCVQTSSGRQADVFILEVSNSSDNPDRLVLKRFFRPHPTNPLSVVRDEFQALESFYPQLKIADVGVVCPEPIKLWEDDRTYLSGFVEGHSLARPTRSLKLDCHSIARHLIDGLSIYYRSVEKPYGDFQPANIIWSPEHIGMIDPSPANPAYAAIASSGAFSPASGDIGYWVFSVVVKTAKHLNQPMSHQREVHLARAIVGAAAENFGGRSSGPFCREVEEVAHWYFSFLRLADTMRSAAIAGIGERRLKSILR